MIKIITILLTANEVFALKRKTEANDLIPNITVYNDRDLVSSEIEEDSLNRAFYDGNWSHTFAVPGFDGALDPPIPNDSCLIEDHDRSLKSTILVTKFLQKSFTYVMPSWRTYGMKFWMKAWSPDIYEGFILSLVSVDKIQEYRLIIGDEDNEKVKLIYINRQSGKSVLLKERILPHLVPSGKWAGYLLKPGKGQIKLSHQGCKYSLFEWTTEKNEFSFQPDYISFGTTTDAWIGISFKYSECLVEDTFGNVENKIYPISLWKSEDDVTTNLKLNLRGTGSARVSLMWTPDLNESLVIEIDAFKRNISFHRHGTLKNCLKLATFTVKDAISAQEWFEYDLGFRKNNLNIRRDGKLLVDWESPFSLEFYWFSVSASGGNIRWSANCPPSDIDGKPRDGSWGDWGPWTCSVSCGRGMGRVERKCDRPSPNIFGRDCKGPAVYQGTCNDFPCGVITPETLTLIRRHLSRNHKALEVKAKERVEIPCNPGILPLVLKEVTNLNITWTHNGVKCRRKKFRVSHNFTLVIPRAKEKHNGVYLCTVHQGLVDEDFSSKFHLEVVSLVVKKNGPTKKVRKGNSMVLKCNGLALSYVYADLSLRWELNGTPFKEYGMGVVEMLTADKLEKVEKEHEGVWTCVVSQENFRFSWVTNWINLKVKNTPNILSNFIKKITSVPIFDKAGNEKDILVIFFSLIVILIWIIIILICSLVKMSRKYKASP